MRSAHGSPAAREPADDRTARARIRDAAIGLVAERGPASLSARGVAKRAGVSPGLVIHHFGSMEALRVACDEHVVALVRQQKHAAFSTGARLDVLALLREADPGDLAGYLAAVLAEDSPAVARLVDELVADALTYLETGVETGMLRPSGDPRARAVVLTLWNLGTLVLNQHLKRLLGTDLTTPDLVRGGGPEISTYLGAVTEVYSQGLFSQEFATRTHDAAARMAAGAQGTSAPADAGGIAPPASTSERGNE